MAKEAAREARAEAERAKAEAEGAKVEAEKAREASRQAEELEVEITQLREEAVRQKSEAEQAAVTARNRGYEAGREVTERVAAEMMKAERAQAAEVMKERDESREQAARLSGEKLGLTEELEKTKLLLAAAYAVPEVIVLPPT